MSDAITLPEGFQWEGTPPTAKAPPTVAAPALPDGYQWEGEPPNTPPTWADSLRDARDTAGPSIVRGLNQLGGTLGDVQTGVKDAADWAFKKLGMDPAEVAAYRAKMDASTPAYPTTQQMTDMTGTGDLHQPTTGLGKVTNSIGEMVPGAATGGVGWRNMLRFAVAPGATSEGAGELADYAGLPSWASKTIRAATALGTSAFGPRVVSPLPASPKRIANSEVLDNAGVTQTAGDRTGSPGLNVWEDTLDPTRHDLQKTQYTNAALKRAGVANPDGLDHEAGGSLDTLLGQASTKYNAVTGRNVFAADAPLVTDLNATRAKYTGTPGLYNDETVNAVNGAQARIAKVIRAGGGQMSGADYQTLRSDLRGAAMNASGDKADALHDIVNRLDNAMERAIGRTNPADQGLFADARDSYKRALVIKKAATMAGPGIAQGDISPAQLGSASQSIYGSRYGANNPFSDLTRAGNAIMKPVASSMTSERQRVNDYIRSGATLGGAALGAKTGGATEAAVLGLLAGNEIAQPIVRGVTRYGLMSRPVQGYLGNQVAAGVPGLLSTAPGALSILRTTGQIPGLFSPGGAQ
jgi:hypothetical protein